MQLTCPPDHLDSLQAGDQIVAVDGYALSVPHTVAAPGDERSVALVNPTPGGTEWRLYADAVARQVTIERADPAPAISAEVRDDVAGRLAALSQAVFNGASNPGLIRRANRIADRMAEHAPDLADRLRAALTTRWEGLGNRVVKVDAIRAEWLKRGAL